MRSQVWNRSQFCGKTSAVGTEKISQFLVAFIAFLSFVVLLSGQISWSINERNSPAPNYIGIVSIDPDDDHLVNHKDAKGFIPFSYKNWVTNSGAIPIVIPHFASDTKILELVRQVNGILFIGGSPLLLDSDNKPTMQQRKLQLVYEEVLRLNKKTNGKYPLWGTWLGFEAIIMAAAKYTIRFSHPYIHDERLPIIWVEDNLKNSLISKKLSPEAIHIVSNNDINYFNQNDGFTVPSFTRNELLTKEFNLVSSYTKKVPDNTLVGIIEHKRYPIIAVQFHPERNLYRETYEYPKQLGIDSLRVEKEFAKILFGDTPMNSNTFKSKKDIRRFSMDSLEVFKIEMYGSVYFFNESTFGLPIPETTEVPDL